MRQRTSPAVLDADPAESSDFRVRPHIYKGIAVCYQGGCSPPEFALSRPDSDLICSRHEEGSQRVCGGARVI